MFPKILHANDGSSPAFHALDFALAIAKQNGSELHMVSVAEIDYLPEFIEEVREDSGIAARRFRSTIHRARTLAEQNGLKLQAHVLTGHPVRDVVRLAGEIDANLIVIGATGHSAIYERLIGSRADRIIQLAHCPVLVVK
jgi:nucleotide-binding universal stress UspA family protein